MSESQKMFASVSGAFIAHLLLLVLVLILPNATSVGSSAARGKNRADRPREVTILMGDLMERLERERIEKKPEPTKPEPPKTDSRPFIATDLNRPEAAAPEDARFESDRNTTAASRLRPDENLPQEKTPTLVGTSPLPHLTLADREYVAGALDQPPATPVVVMPPAPAPGAFPAAPAPASAANELPEPSQAETVSPNETGPREQGPETVADRTINPGMKGTQEEGETSEKSYLAPDANVPSPLIREVPDGKDRLATGVGSGKEGRDAPDPLAPSTQEGAMSAARSEPREEPAAPAEDPTEAAASQPREKPMLQPADEALFAKGFSPEERQNVINGSLAKEGADAVDAIGTPMGKYKKAVRDVISAKWHEYRQKNADFVTWGILKLEFSVDAAGRVHDLQITKNEANAMLAEFSLRAIREAKLPPMPAEVAESVGAKGLVIQYDIIIY
jgi:outer membrane biosynthesis protein TonB